MSVDSLLVELERHPLPLDGGLGTLLEANGHDLSSGLWSARLLADKPQEITRAHREYVEAGARVVISASYQSSFEGYAAYGMDEPQSAELMRRSIDLARAGQGDPRGDPLWVAGSVGPYGAMLADGSEYRGHYGLTVEQLRAWHRPASLRSRRLAPICSRPRPSPASPRSRRSRPNSTRPRRRAGSA